MKLSSVIKLGVAATALLLIPRRSSPQADKIRKDKAKIKTDKILNAFNKADNQ